MALVHEELRKAGIHLDARGRDPAVRAECTRLARIFLQRELQLIGLVPASDTIGVPAAAVQLGLGLVDVTGSPVAVVDAHGSWPGASALGAQAAPDTSLFATQWLVENLALLSPRTFDIGALLPRLQAALREEAEHFHHLLVDLTGFDHLGELLPAVALLPGFVVIARSGRTRFPELERWAHRLPAAKNLGVLLVGG